MRSRDRLCSSAGFYYFVLADNWGGVPLKLTYTKSPLEPNLPRAPLADVYAQVVQDMKDAEGLVKNITTYGFNWPHQQNCGAGDAGPVYLTHGG